MGYVAYFLYNHEAIAQTLCINKSRSELHCNGKCYLAKKIKQAQSRTQQRATLWPSTREVTLWYADYLIFQFAYTPDMLRTKMQFFYGLKPAFSPLAGIFRHPKW